MNNEKEKKINTTAIELTDEEAENAAGGFDLQGAWQDGIDKITGAVFSTLVPRDGTAQGEISGNEHKTYG